MKVVFHGIDRKGVHFPELLFNGETVSLDGKLGRLELGKGNTFDYLVFENAELVEDSDPVKEEFSIFSPGELKVLFDNACNRSRLNFKPETGNLYDLVLAVDQKVVGGSTIFGLGNGDEGEAPTGPWMNLTNGEAGAFVGQIRTGKSIDCGDGTVKLKLEVDTSLKDRWRVTFYANDREVGVARIVEPGSISCIQLNKAEKGRRLRATARAIKTKKVEVFVKDDGSYTYRSDLTFHRETQAEQANITSVEFSGEQFPGAKNPPRASVAGRTLIDGGFGTLSIDSTGAFEYELNPEMSKKLTDGALASDSFTYFLGDESEGSELLITIDGSED